jgi:hypothetical protein
VLLSANKRDSTESRLSRFFAMQKNKFSPFGRNFMNVRNNKIKRIKKVTVRFTFTELSTVKMKARETGRKATARYIREAALGMELKVKRLTSEEKELYKAMVGIANNVNQIAKHYNQGVITHAELLKTHSALREIIIKLIGNDRKNQNG